MDSVDSSSKTESSKQIEQASNHPSPKRARVVNNSCEVDPTSCSNELKDEGKIWVRYAKSLLTMNDREILLNGKELNDRHIHFASVLLKEQFPLTAGLNNTLFQDKCRNLPENSVQPVHCKSRNHWIVASNKSCDGHEVDIYDSLFIDIDPETRSLLIQMFSLNDKHPVINMKKTQRQSGSVDCGLYAIAFMTSLAYGQDPRMTVYCQDKMRSHLTGCFTNKKMLSFPCISNSTTP